MGIPKTHEGDLFNRALSRVGDARLVLEAEKAVTGITAANPPVVSVAAHGYVDGDRVLLYDLTSGGLSTTGELTGRVFEIDVLTAGTFSLPRETGGGYGPVTAGFCRRLPSTKAARTVFDAWARIRDEVIRSHPWNSVVRRIRLARSLPSGLATITAITAAANASVTTSFAHGYTTGDLVSITGVVGMVEVNDRYYTITVTGANTFLLGIDSSSYQPWSSGGTLIKAYPPLTPDFGYAYKYEVPEDCERVLSIEESDRAVWETEGRWVFTDIGITVPVRYARKITDPDQFDAQLTTVLVARLAVEISEELTQSNSKKQELKDDYSGLMAEAKRLDAQEQSGMDFAEDDWVTARL